MGEQLLGYRPHIQLETLVNKKNETAIYGLDKMHPEFSLALNV